MSARPLRRLPAAAGRTAVEKIEMQNFARRLHEILIQKGMNQSDLARAIWGSTTDKRGYDVARNRERISAYLRGESLPEPQNLQRIAEVLNIPTEELAPDITTATVERENPEVALTAIAGHMDKVHLQVNKLVPMAVAVKVLSLLTEGDGK